MPTWSELIEIAPWLAAIALIAAIVAGIVKWVWPIGVKLVHFLDDVAGEPARPGVPARPGLMERVGTIEEKLEHVHHEVFPNSGNSLRDRVDQTNRAIAETKGALDEANEKLDNDNRRINDLVVVVEDIRSDTRTTTANESKEKEQ